MSEGRFSLPTDFPSPSMLSRPAIWQGVWEEFMALVSSIEMTHKDRQTIHRSTRCLFSVAEGPNGQRCMLHSAVKPTCAFPAPRGVLRSISPVIAKTMSNLRNGLDGRLDEKLAPSNWLRILDR